MMMMLIKIGVKIETLPLEQQWLHLLFDKNKGS
jgi:hypothetical protein